MALSPVFKIQLRQDIERCESQELVNGSEALYGELVTRYSKLIKNFMQNLPMSRKMPTFACGADYRTELQLIASKLRTYLFVQERGENAMGNPLKAKVDEFIQRGEDIVRMEFHPAGNGFSISYTSGPLCDAWLGEINIFNERYLNKHPLYQSISSTYFHRKNPSTYKDMMGHLRALSADTEFFISEPTQLQNSAERNIMSNKIFIVHGHDDAAKFEVARTLETAGFEAIILHEQPDTGRTIIQKFEDYANVSYAVILYTECDKGRDKNELVDSEKYRARQNVVLEHGFFIGKLGRDHVCALVKGNVETPGDLDGVIYVDMDKEGAWKLKLAKNMKAVGLSIDANKLI